MPKTEIDYSNTIIYKITCKDPNITDLYVGHTTNFVQRKHAHKQSCINDKSLNYNCKLYQVIRNNGGWSNWSMEIINFFNCKDHYEARKKEQDYFVLLQATLNSIEPMPKPKSIQEIKKNEIISTSVNYCKICNIHFETLKMIEIHNETKEHLKKQQNIPENAKNAVKYICDFCDFNTCKKSNYEKHLITPKHEKNSKILQILQNTTNMAPENASDMKNKNYDCNCGKSYKHHSSLWNHKKYCIQNIESSESAEKKEPDEDVTNDNDENIVIEISPKEMDMQSTIVELLKQNQEFQKQIIELMKDNMGNSNTTNNNIINNTTNNKFNLNVFLNETCKDALNLSDFLESLILTLTDFENFGPLGYCGGISNILVRGLNKLDISKRPIHCSDLKREVIHIKNNDTWHKDEDNQQMIKAIKAIEHKNIKQMSLWGKANPEYKDPNHKKSDLYTKLIDQSLCDTDKEKARKNYNKIIRTVAKEVLVDKS